MIALAFNHARTHWGRSILLCACVFLITAVPLASRSVVASFERHLRTRAQTVPMMVGAAGSRFDLLLSGLHWRSADITPIDLGVVDEIRSEPGTLAMPVHARFRAQGEPIAAVPFEYFEFRGLRPARGRLVAGLGEAVLGSGAAQSLGLGPGDDLPSDQRRSYDISAPPAVVLRVVGVLERTGTADDRAVFVDLETAWLLEGITHGHEDASGIDDPEKLIGRSDDRTALSGAVVEYQRVDASNAGSFHIHAERNQLPVTAVLVVPGSEKSAAIVRTRVNADPTRQAIDPAAVAEELIGSVLRVRRLVDAVSTVIGLAMIGLLTLVGWLTYRTRSDEIRILRDVGASRAQIAALFASEFVGLAGIGIVCAGIVAWLFAGTADYLLVLFD